MKPHTVPGIEHEVEVVMLARRISILANAQGTRHAEVAHQSTVRAFYQQVFCTPVQTPDRLPAGSLYFAANGPAQGCIAHAYLFDHTPMQAGLDAAQSGFNFW
jgi:hypothetical protein